MKAYVVEREHLAQNIRAIREEAGESIVWAVLKGNGYGLGVVQMAELMRENGIDHFAVTEAREARLLREVGFEESPILMLRQTMEPELIHEHRRLIRRRRSAGCCGSRALRDGGGPFEN